MRQFVVVGHEAPTTPEFSLDDLPGSGRLDVLCRCVVAGCLLSHSIRSAVRVHLVLDDAFTITVDSDEVRNLRPDERSTAALLRTALEHREEAIGHQPVQSSPGVTIRRTGLEHAIDTLAEEGTLVVLDEDGTPVDEHPPPSDPVFVLSDHLSFSDAERALLADRATATVSLGPEPLHADQAITVAHAALDTAGFDHGSP
jgi:tRNA (pseudouridine54-N1)-methyltransferase